MLPRPGRQERDLHRRHRGRARHRHRRPRRAHHHARELALARHRLRARPSSSIATRSAATSRASSATCTRAASTMPCVRVARVTPDGDKVRVTIEIDGRPRRSSSSRSTVAGDEAVEAIAHARRLRTAIARVLRDGRAPRRGQGRRSREGRAEGPHVARSCRRARGATRPRSTSRSATARVTFTVTPGPVALIGAIQWKGTGELPGGQAPPRLRGQGGRPLFERRRRRGPPGAPRSRRLRVGRGRARHEGARRPRTSFR